MLKLAKEKFKSDKNFSFSEGTFAQIPLKDKSADKIISTSTVGYPLESNIRTKKNS